MSLILINPILYDWGQDTTKFDAKPYLSQTSIRLEIKASGNATAAPPMGEFLSPLLPICSS
ncbi:MAG: hypothetical protein R2865_08510 [Deinococcales bacterium]